MQRLAPWAYLAITRLMTMRTTAPIRRSPPFWLLIGVPRLIALAYQAGLFDVALGFSTRTPRLNMAFSIAGQD